MLDSSTNKNKVNMLEWINNSWKKYVEDRKFISETLFEHLGDAKKGDTLNKNRKKLIKSLHEKEDINLSVNSFKEVIEDLLDEKDKKEFLEMSDEDIGKIIIEGIIHRIASKCWDRSIKAHISKNLEQEKRKAETNRRKKLEEVLKNDIEEVIQKIDFDIDINSSIEAHRFHLYKELYRFLHIVDMVEEKLGDDDFLYKFIVDRKLLDKAIKLRLDHLNKAYITMSCHECNEIGENRTFPWSVRPRSKDLGRGVQPSETHLNVVLCNACYAYVKPKHITHHDDDGDFNEYIHIQLYGWDWHDAYDYIYCLIGLGKQSCTINNVDLI